MARWICGARPNITGYSSAQFGMHSYTGLSQFRSQTSAVRKVLPAESIFPKLLPSNSLQVGVP